MTVQIVANRRRFNISENDVVLFNGACWQLITQMYSEGWDNYYPVLSSTKCEKWKKNGVFQLFDEKVNGKTADGKQIGLWYYKFDLQKLEEELKGEK